MKRLAPFPLGNQEWLIFSQYRTKQEQIGPQYQIKNEDYSLGQFIFPISISKKAIWPH